MNLNDLPEITVPHSQEAEQFVIGALLQSNDAFDRIADLRPEQFYSYDHRQIFSAIQKLIMQNKPADVLTVFDWLQGQGYKAADLTYLNAMAQNTPSAANIARYAGIVKDRAKKRELMTFSKEVADLATSGEDADKLVDQITSKVNAMQQETSEDEPQHITDDLAAFIDDFDERYHGRGTPRISTGFRDLDDKLNGGLVGGQLVIVAARPKMGKTAFALNVTNRMAEDRPVLFFSLEMPKKEIHERNISSLGKIPMDRVIQPKKMQPDDWPKLTHAIGRINNLKLYVDVKPGATLMNIRMKAKGIKRKHGLGAIVIDYLQLMNGEGDNRNAQIEAITRGLKNLAKELDVPVILLSQLNRNLENRPNKRPQPADLRDSGSIEQDADIAIFLYRDEVYNPDTPDVGICEADVALQRQGAKGVVRLVFVGEQTRFEDLAHDWRPRVVEPKPRSSRGFE